MAPFNMLELLGEAIREIRIERGMTQQQLADACETERTFIVALEKGRKNASTTTVVNLARGLGVLPHELFRRFTKKAMRSIPVSQLKRGSGDR
jgi:transcriptional regulator with XRE-family HTH domain